MKKKNLTINRLAIGNLKARKKQYTIMIIGILLSMIFSSGVLFLISCMQSSGEELARQQTGTAYAILYDNDGFIDPEGDFEKQYISDYGYAHIIGYGYADEEKKDRGTSIAYLDEEARDLYYVTLKEGREPEKKGEIAIESTALAMLGKNKAKIGDKITLSVQTPNGDEFMECAEEKTYTLVGIFADKRTNIGEYRTTDESKTVAKLPTAFVHESERVKSGGKEINVLYYKVFEEKLEVKTTAFGNILKECDYDTEFLIPLRAKISGRYIDHVYSSIYGISSLRADSGFYLYALLSLVLMLASCIGIVNSFSANLQERKKQIGMLRAVGATRRQIINIFGREAFIISLICAPISVAISYFGVKLFAYLMGDNFIFIPNFLVLLGTTAVSVICVMLAAFIPLFASSRISPMQAIRNIELSRKMKNKNIKSQTSFDPSKLLAKRSLSLHRGKQISVSIILAATILLSCFGFSFMKIEMKEAEISSFRSDYMLRRVEEHGLVCDFVNCTSLADGFTENDKRELEEFYLAEEVYSFKKYMALLNVEKYTPYLNIMTAEWDNNCRYVSDLMSLSFGTETKINDDNFVETIYPGGEYETYKELKETAGFEKEVIQTPLTFYSAEIIEKYKDEFEIIDGRIDIDKLNSGEEIILVAVREAGLYLAEDDDGRVATVGVQDMDEPLYRYQKESDIKYTAPLEYKAGDTLEMSTLYSGITEYPEEDGELPEGITRCDKKVKIGAIVRPFYFSDVFSEYRSFALLSTINAQPLLTAEDSLYEDIVINISGEIDDETDSTVSQFLKTYTSGTNFEVYSDYARDKEYEEYVRSMLIGMISIIILFFSTGTAIINNTLTAKIRESKREIGTLRAVGASVKELTLSYVLQMISMFLWGSVAGFGLYSIAHVVLKLILKDDWVYPFTIWHGLVAIALLIVICSINLYSKVKKEMKNSIVENIREL